MNHFERLSKMYLSAPIHAYYKGIELIISTGMAEIKLPVDERYFHAAMAVHGSVYFKLLDDSAYFACQSDVPDFFLLTKKFTVELKRPVTEGSMIATGKLVSFDGHTYFGQSEITNLQGKIIATGQGEFVKGKTGLTEVKGY